VFHGRNPVEVDRRATACSVYNPYTLVTAKAAEVA